MILRSGSYTGDGTNPRTISVSDAGGALDFVHIMSDNDRAVFVTSGTDSGQTYYYTNDTVSFTGGITIGTNQFQVDSGSNVNTSGKHYFWLAARNNAASDFSVGSYTGNGTSQNITTVGFQPDFVIVKANVTIVNNTEAVWWDSNDATHSTLFDGNIVASTTMVTGALSNGFSIGAADSVNHNTNKYFYIAWKSVVGKTKPINYTGNGTTGHGITGAGFKPDMSWVLDFTIGRNTAGRQRDASGANQAVGFQSIGFLTDGISSLDSDGLTVGALAQTNNNTDTFHSMSFLAPAPVSGIPNKIYEVNQAINRSYVW